MSNEKSAFRGGSSFRLEISGGALLILSFTGFLCGGEALCAALTASAVHELGHLAVILGQGSVPRSLRLDASGACLNCAGPAPEPREELLRAAAGPAAGLLLWLTLRLWGGPTMRSMGEMSLLLSLVNLLPADGLDGGRILRCLCVGAPLPLTERLGMLLGLAACALTLLLGFLFSPQLLLYGLWLSLGLLHRRIDFASGFVYDGNTKSKGRDRACIRSWRRSCRRYRSRRGTPAANSGKY